MFLALAIAAICGAARGHQAPSGWEYSPWCCNGAGPHGDCAEVHDVRATATGWIVTIAPGTHPKVPAGSPPRQYVIPYGDPAVKKSGDDSYHLCLYPTPDNVRCFYTPPMGF